MFRRLFFLIAAVALTLAAWPASAAGARVNSVESFVSAFVQGVDSGTLPFVIHCSNTVYGEFFGTDNTLLAGLYSCCGITSFNYSTLPENGGTTVTVTAMDKYPGRAIVDAVRAGTVSRLSEREQATLSAAMRITAGIGGTQLERERQLHDWLCGHVTYTRLEGPRSENDSAVGALLNGKADCDGYADAFYLLCTLSGIECRHIHGVSTDSSGYSGSHMWNAVRLDNRWVMVDVTWDDLEDTVSYMYFNLGSDRMAVSHTWERRSLPFSVVYSENADLKPDAVYTAAADTWLQVEERLADAVSRSCTHCQLQVSAGVNLSADLERLSGLIYGLGVEDYRWSFTRGRAEIIFIRQHAHYRHCASEAEAIRFIDSFAGTVPPEEIKLGFTHALGARLFADDRGDLETMLARTRLANPGVYSYSDSSRTVTLRSVSYIEAPAEVHTVGELQAFLRNALINRPQEIVLLADSSLGLAADLSPVDSVICRCGVKGGYSYRFTGNLRLTLTKLTYYDWFSYCETEEDMLRCMREYRWADCPEFTLYCSDALYAALSRDGSGTVFRLLREAGYPDATLRSSDAYCFYLVSAGS